jgi:NADH-quinone oxidoreductase subunit N
MFMAAANDLIVIFVALELLSIPLYVLSGFRRPEVKSEESALKYFLLGAFSSGFLVFGIALIYGATGTTRLPGVWAGVSAIVESGSQSAVLILAGAALILVALGFKVAAVPFHMWTPDVYEGAPTPVTAFMSVGAKAGGFAAMLRVLVVGLPTLMIASQTAAAWVDTVALLAVLTMIMGNFAAIMQTNLKRMLAYSSIAHAGYILMAVAAAGHPGVAQQGVQAALIYLLTYAFTNLGAFAVIIAMERDDASGITLDDLRGLSRQRPWLALLMAFFMLSLTGIPLTAGFVGKWYVFWASISAGQNLVALIGVLTSIVGAYYYVRVIVRMFLEDGEAEPYTARLPRALSTSVLVAFLGTLILGVLPFLVADMGAGVQIALAALGGGG